MEHLLVNPSEKRIVGELRDLKPFERLEVVADKEGKPGVYMITRISKAILVAGGITYVK